MQRARGCRSSRCASASWPSSARDTDFTLRPPREPGETLWVLRARHVGTARSTSIRPPAPSKAGAATHEGAYNLLFELHSSLLLDDTGKGILAFVALAYLLLLITGLVLWWPTRWPPSCASTLDRGLLRGLFDLHRTGGALLGLLIAGVGADRRLHGLAAAAAASSARRHRVAPIKPPAVPKGAGRRPAGSRSTRWSRARSSVFPGQPIGYIQVPAAAGRVRCRCASGWPTIRIRTAQLGLAASASPARCWRSRRWNALDAGYARGGRDLPACTPARSAGPRTGASRR